MTASLDRLIKQCPECKSGMTAKRDDDTAFWECLYCGYMESATKGTVFLEVKDARAHSINYSLGAVTPGRFE